MNRHSSGSIADWYHRYPGGIHHISGRLDPDILLDGCIGLDCSHNLPHMPEVLFDPASVDTCPERDCKPSAQVSVLKII